MRFEKVEDGYKDSETGLIWKDKDESYEFIYKGAMELNGDVWRLPTVQELLSIVDYTKHKPATKLPGIKASGYWSASPDIHYSDSAWSVHFNCGDSYGHYRNHYRYIRLIRK